MSSKGLQLFASGIFFATTGLLAVYLYSTENEELIKINPPLTVAEMREELETNGYLVVPAEELKELKKEIFHSEKNEHEQETIYILFLEIVPGMSSYDVADLLLAGKIINNREDFLQQVEHLRLSKSLKTGFYEVRSDMSIDEIVQIIS
ncbi:hypothetical protein [Halalkalibacter krulwichiae]|uniref:YceG-like family protein n=1 Tax=Halalkalibacter krulwichiae TaxID=199441 RepID=A0A1X9M7J0_9BACI|nr:hypothetical protein [Halalkalibacter krulwichiae]ARK29376.1 hypothetical protein BkAM31D_05660 [Halalkalibacter krulwichiae]